MQKWYAILSAKILATMYLIRWILIFCAWLVVLPQPAWPQLNAVSLAKSMQVLRSLVGITETDLDAARTRLPELSYTQNRVFQLLCRLPAAEGGQIGALLDLAGRYELRFEHLPLFAGFVSCKDADLAGCQQLLMMLTHTDFLQAQTLAAISGVDVRDGARLLQLVQKTSPLPETGLWAAKALFGRPQLDGMTGLRAVDLLTAMTEEQQRTAEKYLGKPYPDSRRLLSDLGVIASLSGGAGVNFRAMCANGTLTSQELSKWLHTFFLLPTAERQQELLRLGDSRRRLLLDTYRRAAETIIWRINSLHSVTDRFGREIGTMALTRMTPDQLLREFHRLPEFIQADYLAGFSAALINGQRVEAIAKLREATAAARRFAADELTAANLYILLANGGELYTSSFREIVSPVLKKRITQDYHGQLLEFLQTIDQEKIYIAACIANLAQKGLLVSFLPKSGAEQERIVDLVADSALADENSLILFSATFANLLQAFVPAVRERLIERLLQAAVDTSQAFSTQVRVILQFYFHTYPELLTSQTREKIGVLLDTLGEIELQEYIRTPFLQWQEDGRLASISTFAGDDDGWASYVSCSRDLLANGYVPVVSGRYRLIEDDAEAVAEIARIVGEVRSSPTASLSALFSKALQQPLVVEWQKTVGKIRISHGLYVFSDAARQQRLLEIFLREGDEMFAQRGHSYYRNSQLLSPLKMLLKERRIDEDLLAAKRRFISLGSCGGVKAYGGINQIFNNTVDIFGTVGTGTAEVNNSFNRRLLEIAARVPAPATWRQVAEMESGTLANGQRDGEYIVPGSLPAILHKMHNGSTTLSADDFDDEP